MGVLQSRGCSQGPRAQHPAQLLVWSRYQGDSAVERQTQLPQANALPSQQPNPWSSPCQPPASPALSKHPTEYSTPASHPSIPQRREEEGQLEAPGWCGLCHLTSADSSSHPGDPNVSVVLLSLPVCVPAPWGLFPASSVGNSQGCRQRETAADFCVFPSHRLWWCLLNRSNLDPSPKISSWSC